MADILIRGMEMPTVCIDNGWYGNCPMDRSWCAQRFAPKDSTNESAHKEQWNKLPSWCPLIPLPEGHGRLIDADALIDALETQDYSCAPDTLEDWTPQDMTVAEIADITHAPTIVPAEGGKHNADPAD